MDQYKVSENVNGNPIYNTTIAISGLTELLSLNPKQTCVPEYNGVAIQDDLE